MTQDTCSMDTSAQEEQLNDDTESESEEENNNVNNNEGSNAEIKAEVETEKCESQFLIPDFVSTDPSGFLTNDEVTTWFKGFGCMFDSNWMHDNQEIFGLRATLNIVRDMPSSARKASKFAERFQGRVKDIVKFIDKRDMTVKPG